MGIIVSAEEVASAKALGQECDFHIQGTARCGICTKRRVGRGEFAEVSSDQTLQGTLAATRTLDVLLRAMGIEWLNHGGRKGRSEGRQDGRMNEGIKGRE